MYIMINLAKRDKEIQQLRNILNVEKRNNPQLGGAVQNILDYLENEKNKPGAPIERIEFVISDIVKQFEN